MTVEQTKALLTGIAHIIDRVITLSASIVAIISLVLLFLSLLAEVIIRYLTTQGLGWPLELPKLLFPWLIMGGIVLAAQRGSHVSVDAIIHALNKHQARMLAIAMQIIVAVAFLALFHTGLKVIAITGSETYPMTGISAKWAYLALITGFLGMAMTALTTSCQLLIGTPLHAKAASDGSEKP